MSEPVVTSIEPTQSVEDPAGAVPEVDVKESAGGLRKQLEGALGEIRELKSGKRDEILASIGLDPQLGLGKALVEKFDEGKLTIENLAEVAVAEYGHVVPEGQHPQAQQIAQGQADIDALQATGGSVAPFTQGDKIAKAEADGDTTTSIALKGDQLINMFGR